MFLDTVLSCSLLLLASGSSVYLTGKWLTDNCFKTQPEIIFASIGVLAINFRSVFNLISPFYFHATYSIDPLEIADEDEEKVQLRILPLFGKCCRVFSMFGLIYAVCEAHRSRKIGILITSTLAFAELYHALCTNYRQQPRTKLFHFLWMLGGGSFGWMKGNHYCSLAYLPYWIAFLGFPPEINCSWSARQIINNYMMMAHIFLMLEAIRTARSID